MTKLEELEVALAVAAAALADAEAAEAAAWDAAWDVFDAALAEVDATVALYVAELQKIHGDKWRMHI